MPWIGLQDKGSYAVVTTEREIQNGELDHDSIIHSYLCYNDIVTYNEYIYVASGIIWARLHFGRISSIIECEKYF